MEWTMDATIRHHAELLAEEFYGARFEDIPERYQEDLMAEAEAAVIAQIERKGC